MRRFECPLCRQAFPRRCFEGLDRTRHIADGIVALEVRHLVIEITRRNTEHSICNPCKRAHHGTEPQPHRKQNRYQLYRTKRQGVVNRLTLGGVKPRAR